MGCIHATCQFASLKNFCRFLLREEGPKKRHERPADRTRIISEMWQSSPPVSTGQGSPSSSEFDRSRYLRLPFGVTVGLRHARLVKKKDIQNKQSSLSGVQSLGTQSYRSGWVRRPDSMSEGDMAITQHSRRAMRAKESHLQRRSVSSCGNSAAHQGSSQEKAILISRNSQNLSLLHLNLGQDLEIFLT